MTADLTVRGVRVKPLEWETVGDEFWARDIYGDHYEVEPTADGFWAVDHPRLYDSSGHVTPEAAKAAAQADYEARILAALELTAHAEAPEVARMLADALATALDALPEDRMTEDRTQLLGALRRYLEGWTP